MREHRTRYAGFAIFIILISLSHVVRLAMIQVSDSTKIFLVTPKFQRLCKCLNNIENLSKSSTYVVVLTNEIPSQKRHFDDDDDSHIDDDMF